MFTMRFRLLFGMTVVFISAGAGIKLDNDYEHYEDYDDLNIDFDDYDFDFLKVKKSTCKHPGPIKHGKVEVWGEGLLLEYTCDEGFIPHGITHGACNIRKAEWTIEPIVCITTDCSLLFPPKHGIVVLDENKGIATITCRQSFQLIGSPVLYCEEGKWSGIFPVCIVTTDLENKSGLNETEEEKLHQKYVKTSDESCFNYHIEPPQILYSLVITSYVMNTDRRRYVMVAKYSCVNGYRLLNGNAAYLYCRNSKWSADVIPRCILDNDPCETDNGGCQHSCLFYPKTNKYTCTCKPGFSVGADGKICEDINECLIDKGGCHQLCVNTRGSFACDCRRGYLANGTSCQDINECATAKKKLCPGPCINKPGNYKCDCKIPGYRPSIKGYFCEDVNECKKKNGRCGDICENTRGSYKCRCDQRGWKLGSDNHSCVDVDECVRYGNKLCLHGECVNFEGGYRCICRPGFKTGADARYCEDNNECDVNNGGCEDRCINTDGSYVCKCSKSGYKKTSNGFHCMDIDECKVNNGGCAGRCINQPGSYRCTCPNVGQVLADDNKSCHACGTDEVYNKISKKCVKCPENARTKPNVITALSDEDCECKPGYSGDPSLYKPCIDVDECELGLVKCEFECNNTVGGAHCVCPNGFQWSSDDEICRDIDECVSDINDCSQVCRNIPGSYRCSCHPGFDLDDDGISCIDIDECQLASTKCAFGCENIAGGYKCICQTGYELNNKTNKCDDIDECSWENAPCNQSCTNIPGSYLCKCDGPGFKLSWDNTACIDINECMEGNNPCGESCQNTIGSFICECNKNGYSSSDNGLRCRDINECASNHTKVCDHLCINVPGSYRCTCHPGYRKHGSTNCAPCPTGYYRGVRDKVCRRCPNHATTTTPGSTSVVECVCREGYSGDPSRSLKCQDIDECTVNNNECSHRCVNTAGSAYCTCRDGFQLDLNKKTCIDIDECKISNGGCEQMCFNQPGSFQCKCNQHYELAPTGKSCRDIDECLNEEHDCSHRCVNIRGGYMCGCHNGYRLQTDNRTCDDIDECNIDNGLCTDKCINNIGSYECKCTIPGFTLYGDGKQCVDINECEDEDLCEDICENTYGSYKCICSGGNINLAEDSHSCDDFDECASNETNACDQICINLRGTYRCDCNPGYYKTSSRCRICPKNSYRDSSMPLTTCLRCPTRSSTPGPGGSALSDCKCIRGYELKHPTSKECSDINDCSEENKHISRCSNTCNNLPGSYFCSCPRGQRLLSDRKSCEANVKCRPLIREKKTIIWPPDCLITRSRRLTPGFTCFTRCHHGYSMSGSRLRRCLHNGQFSGTVAKCTKIMCTGLRSIPNGKLYPPRCRNKMVPFGSRCQVKCLKGFVLIGRIGTKCRTTKKWSHRLKTSCVPEINTVHE